MPKRAIRRYIIYRKVRYIILTQEQLNQILCQTLISYAEGSPASHSALPEDGEDLRMQEALSFLNSHVLPLPKDLVICCLKTYPASYRMTRGKPSPLSSKHFANWGMAWNGLCLTRRITESRNPGVECSLSDILIEGVPEKYYLTEKQIQKLLYK